MSRANQQVEFYVRNSLGMWFGIVDIACWDTYYKDYKKSWACGPGRMGEYEN